MPSSVWMYFTNNKLNNQAKCNICKFDIKCGSSSTSGPWSHLKSKHSKKYDELKKEEIQQMDEIPAKRPHNDLFNSFSQKESISCEEETVCKFVVRQNLPFSAIEDQDFQKILRKSYPSLQVE